MYDTLASTLPQTTTTAPVHMPINRIKMTIHVQRLEWYET